MEQKYFTKYAGSFLHCSDLFIIGQPWFSDGSAPSKFVKMVE